MIVNENPKLIVAFAIDLKVVFQKFLRGQAKMLIHTLCDLMLFQNDEINYGEPFLLIYHFYKHDLVIKDMSWDILH